MLVKRASDPIVSPMPPIGVAVVADREVTRGALLGLVSGDPELTFAGSAADPKSGEALLASSDVQVMLVSLSLALPADGPAGVYVQLNRAGPTSACFR